VLKSVLEHLSQKYQLIEDNSSTEQEDVKKDYTCLLFQISDNDHHGN
jgi:hypothetical protein